MPTPTGASRLSEKPKSKKIAFVPQFLTGRPLFCRKSESELFLSQTRSLNPVMAMRVVATKAAALSAVAPRGLSALFSSASGLPFNLPSTPVEKPPSAEPSTNLFISGLSKRTTTEGLRNAFAKFGQVVTARVVTDRVSGYSKGFGFVNYATLDEAEAGIKGMHGQFLDGWVIFAEYARPRPPLPSNNTRPPNSQQW